MKEQFPKFSNFNSRKNSATNSKLDYNCVRNSDLPYYLTDWREVIFTNEMKTLFPDANDNAKGWGHTWVGFREISKLTLHMISKISTKVAIVGMVIYKKFA